MIYLGKAQQKWRLRLEVSLFTYMLIGGLIGGLIGYLTI